MKVSFDYDGTLALPHVEVFAKELVDKGYEVCGSSRDAQINLFSNLIKLGIKEKIKFYSNLTKKSMWDEIDILLTSNPNLILEKPKDKIVVKFNTRYNKNVDCEYEINSLKEFDETLQKIGLC